MTSSLRARLSLLTGVVTVVLVSLASVLVIRQTWERESTTLLDDAVLIAETRDLSIAEQFDAGRAFDLGDAPPDGFVAAFDGTGLLISGTGALDATTWSEIGDEWVVADTSPFDLFADDAEIDGRDWVVATTGCLAEERCTAVMVGLPRTGFVDYLAARLGWVVLIALAVGIGTAAATRWIVGRSLRPVDAMRRELDEITADDLDRRVEVPASGDELEALGTSFNQTIERLAAGVESQRRFSSDAAHELRSPLAGLRATLEVAQRQPTRTSDAIDTAIDQVDRTSSLLDDLLVLARRDGGGTQLPRRIADIDDVVREQLRDIPPRDGVTIDRSGIGAVQSTVEPGSVARVVRNLVDNALAHAASTIRVTLDGDGDAWTLCVDDDGPGVPPGDRTRIFDRFTRLDESRSRDTGGSGLGLAIVAELVAEHDGTVAVADSDLGGASFRVTVPI